jgi:hypothetical protein
MSEFPLCARAGLSVINPAHQHPNFNIAQDFVRAADVEKLLAAAPVVYGPSVERFDSPWSRDKVVFDSEGGKMSINAQARLLLIEPLVQETPESFIREWVAYEEEQIRKDGPYVLSRIPKFIERARKLLGQEGE